MAAILLTLPGVSYVLGWLTLRGLRFERELPGLAWEGEEAAFTYVARNPTRWTRFFLTIQEALPAWITPVDEEPGLFNVGAGDSEKVSVPMRFHRRGLFQATHFDVTALDPLGVFAFTRRIPCEGEMVVYPLPQKLRADVLSGTERYGWQEFTSRLLHGSSIDPDGVRPYVPGDAMKRIHWRQTARTGKLSVIEFEEAQSTNLIIALDLERGTDVGEDTETTLEYGVRLAASLAQEAIQQGASVRLLLPPSGEASLEEAALLMVGNGDARGQAHLFRILDSLARVEANSSVSLSALLEEHVARVPAGATLLAITSKPDPQLSKALLPFHAAQANIGVAYIPPDGFRRSKQASHSLEQQFLAGLASIGAQTFMVQRHPEGILNPEAVSYVHEAQPAAG